MPAGAWSLLWGTVVHRPYVYAFFACFLAFALGSSRLEQWICGVLLVSSALVVASFIGLSAVFGLGIEYRFEVAAITIVWLTLSVVGVMLAFLFARLESRR